MKKFLLLCASSMMFSAVSAQGYQGYAGVLAAATKFDWRCGTGDNDKCDKSHSGFRLFAGVNIPKEQARSMGPVAFDAWEIGYSRFGRAVEDVPGGASVYDPDWTDPDLQFVPADLRRQLRVDALTASAIAHVPVGSRARLAGRLGVAYVSAELADAVNGSSRKAVTKNSLQPYAGIGFEVDVSSSATISGVYDLVRFRVGGESGHVSFIGLGAQTKF